jgi:hypothetical protein
MRQSVIVTLTVCDGHRRALGKRQSVISWDDLPEHQVGLTLSVTTQGHPNRLPPAGLRAI